MSLATDIRDLQRKLDALLEAPEDEAGAVATPVAAPAAAAPTPLEPAAATKAPTDGIPTIEAGTFKQAYAQAVKQGLKKFRWCGVYAVKAAPPAPPVQPRPTPAPTPDRINSQYSDGSYVGGIGLPSQTPVFNMGS